MLVVGDPGKLREAPGTTKSLVAAKPWKQPKSQRGTGGRNPIMTWTNDGLGAQDPRSHRNFARGRKPRGSENQGPRAGLRGPGAQKLGAQVACRAL